MITVHTIPILEDNYAYIVQSSDGKTAVIDPGEAPQIINFLENHNITPDYIINTHHHWDHVNGNPALVKKYNTFVIAPRNDVHKIKHVDRLLDDGEVFMLGSDAMYVIETSGHTMGGICLWFKDSNILFTGDTIFSMGCGRLFEGSPKDMFASFQKIAALPDDTMIYCGHEYTLHNARFCQSITPDNEDLKARLAQAQELRAQNLPTIPVTLSVEKKTNVFFNAKTPEEFKHLRELRNSY